MIQTKAVRDILGFNLSPSSINTYAQCPFKWKIVYLDGLRPLDTHHTVSGKTFHKIFEVVTKSYKKDIFLKGRETYIIQLCLAIPPSDWKHLMLPIFKLYAKSECERFDTILTFVESDVDEAWDYFVPLETERKYELNNEGITFIVDRLLKIPAGMGRNMEEKKCVFDFKPKGDNYTTNLNRQLTSMAIHIDDDGEMPLVGGYFYRSGIMLPIKAVHWKSVKGVVDIVNNMLTSLKWGRFKKNIGWDCRFCAFRIECRAKIPLKEVLVNKQQRNDFVGGVFDSISRNNIKAIRYNGERNRTKKGVD